MVIVIVIIGISFLILVHEFGHFLAAKSFGLLVEEFGFGFPPKIFSKKIGETVYSLNLLPFGGFVKIYGETPQSGAMDRLRSFSHQSAGKRILVILAGVLMNFIFGWLIISSVYIIGVPRSLVITGLNENSPAALAGIKIGDQIADFKESDDFIGFVKENRGREIILNIKRGGESIPFKLIPRVDAPPGEGALGVAFSEAGLEKQPLLRSFVEGFKTSILIIGSIFSGLWSLLVGLFTQGKILEGFVGPVGIFGFANQAAGLGLVYLLQLIGLISLNLFVLNVLPFPALDGGRLFFILIEKIKGSPLSPNFEKSANAFGFIVLLILMIAITVRDIGRLF